MANSTSTKGIPTLPSSKRGVLDRRLLTRSYTRGMRPHDLWNQSQLCGLEKPVRVPDRSFATLVVPHMGVDPYRVDATGEGRIDVGGDAVAHQPRSRCIDVQL